MEQLAKLHNKISLEDEEDSGLVIEPGAEEERSDKQKWRLAGRFLSDRKVNFQAMQSTPSALWRPVKWVYIKAINPNLFLFKFFHELDLERVRNGGPWTFDRCVLLTKHQQEDEEPSDVELFDIELYVQRYDLPTGLQSGSVGYLWR